MLYPFDQPEVYVKCKTCLIDYPRTKEYFNIYSAKGKRNFRKRCKECHGAQVKNWQNNNPETLRNYVRKYQEANPEVRGVYARNRRARKLNAKSKRYTEAEVISAYGSACHICSEQIDLTSPRSTHVQGWEQGLHLDHLIPLSIGGSDTIENIRPAHGKCNLSRPRDGSDMLDTL